jgi:hypothetical protein
MKTILLIHLVHLAAAALQHLEAIIHSIGHLIK